MFVVVLYGSYFIITGHEITTLEFINYFLS